MINRFLLAALCGVASLSLPGPASAQVPDGEQIGSASPALGGRYAAKGWADRIILSPGADASREMAVAWRTDLRQGDSVAEIAPDRDGPGLAAAAVTVRGSSLVLKTENGMARHHHVRFTGLSPASRYVYRVRGADGWSEWLPFQTAASTPAPFRFVYFGDTQDDILEIGSRVIRSAFHTGGPVALAVHAGDQVSQRRAKAHDDEYGEWMEAGGAAFRTIPQLVAAGNHEYQDSTTPDGRESRVLGALWAHYALPDNGAPGAERTSYHVDYQNVRFIVLDGTSAIDLGTLEAQTAWLRRTLEASTARWNIVLMHQPLYTCARPRDTEPLKQVWGPILEQARVDLVLQGHDHCYARVVDPDGAVATRETVAAGAPVGPVYMVSVVGSKMYGLNDRAATQPVRVAEETQLYQLVDVEQDRLTLRAYTATGRLYDGFSLVRGADGRNRLEEMAADLPPIRRCQGGQGPDGQPCTARTKD